MPHQEAKRDSYLLRIWRPANQADWQGWVQHIQSGETKALQSLSELQAFLERYSGKLQAPPRKGLK
jgi:hypothetical protein